MVAMYDCILLEISGIPIYLIHKMPIHRNTSGSWKDRGSPLGSFQDLSCDLVEVVAPEGLEKKE